MQAELKALKGFFVEQVQVGMCEEFQVNRTLWVRSVAGQTVRGR